MPHTIEPATSGRAGCRGCGAKIAKGELRLGERFPNPFAEEGELTLWFHLACAAYKRPETMLETLAASEASVERADWLAAAARLGVEHRRLPRVDGAERSPTGRATCRGCRDKIEKDGWRIRLVFFEEDRFAPAGFVHARCAREYFGTTDLLDRVEHFSDGLTPADTAEIAAAMAE